MNQHKTTVFLLLTILVLTSIFAQSASAVLVVNKYTNEFAASSPYNEQLKLCACETKVDRIIIENTGDFIADFDVRIQSAYPNSIKVPESSFQLAPKHFKEVLVYIEDSCGVQGTFPYDVTVTNSYGRIQTLSRTIRVDMCQTALLDVTPAKVTVGLCEEGTFNVTVTNVGTFADSFSLDFGPYNGIADAEMKDLYLKPGQSYSQDVGFTFPCTEYGTKIIPFVVFTGKNGFGADAQREMEITNDYSYSIDLPASVNVCTQTTTTVPIEVSNDARVDDEVSLRVVGPSFATLSEQLVELDSREDKTVQLSIAAPEGAEGEHTITIEAIDRYGQKQKTRDITVTLADCYDPKVELRDTPEHAIEGPLVTCCGLKTYYVNVRNDGDREQLFNLAVDGPSFFELDETTVRIAPGQNMNVPLRANMPCNDARYEAEVSVWPTNAQHVNDSATIVIDSQTLRTCHMVQIDDDELRVKDDMTVLPVIVKHTGTEGGLYEITTNSTLFTVQEEDIQLFPGDQRAIHMIVKDGINLTAQERGRYIVQPVFNLVDPDLNIDYREHVGVRLEEKGFFQRLADWFFGLPWGGLGLCGWVIILLGIALLVFAVLLILIWLGIISLPSMSRFALTVIKTILVLCIVLFLVFIAFLQPPSDTVLYERVADTTDSTVIEWYQNTQKTIDMDQYFDDPDLDYLRYTVTQPRDIKLNMDGSELTLTPDHNFAGENTMVITASDSKGGVTDSPVFVLRVIPMKTMGFLDWLHAWCHYIVVVIVVAILLVLFLIVLTIKERRQDLTKDHVLVYVPNDKKTTAKPVAKTAKAPAKKTAVKKAKVMPRAVIVARAPTRTALPIKRPQKAVVRKTSVVKKASVRNAPSKRAKVTVKTRKPAKGVMIRETKSDGKTVNIEVNAPAQPSQQGPTIVTVPGAKVNEIVYIGMKGGNTVHTPYCMNARRIPRGKRVAYSTKKEAINAGLVPCRLCRPFEGGI